MPEHDNDIHRSDDPPPPVVRRTPIERLIGFGVAGLLCGCIVGALLFRSGPVEPRDPAPSADGDSTAGVVAESATGGDSAGHPPGDVAGGAGAAVEQTGEGAATPAAEGDADSPLSVSSDEDAIPEDREPATPQEAPKGISPALAAAIEADDWFLSVRRTVHEAVGTGALAGPDGLTMLGKTVMERVATIPDHALDATPYQVLQLEDLVAGATDEASRAKLEAALGKAVVLLVLDYRFVRRSGPFRLRTARTLSERPPALKRIARVAVKMVTAETPEQVLAAIDPPHINYAAMVGAYKRYRDLVDAECPRLLRSWKIRPGQRGQPVRLLQQRLQCEGFYDGPVNGIHDEATVRATKVYQRTHDLDDDGFAYGTTLRSMNVPLERRWKQIGLAMQRMRESDVWKMGDYYLVVNIPAFEVRAIENGEILARHKVIVGTNRLDDDKNALIQGHLNRTRLFTTRLNSVTINPDWILPARIARGELQGQIDKDPEYLAKHNIRQQTLPSGQTVYVQGFGEGNVLGKVKFLLEKSNAIYLHDTDKPGLFRHRRRDFSHGCMRVHEAVDFGRFVVTKDGYEAEEYDRALRLQRTQRGMKLTHPIDFMTEYVTVDIDAAGRPVFLTDVYKYDQAYFDGELPPLATVRWGDVRLRPRWVPLVPKREVDEWRRAGKSAPRNYNARSGG